ncbi:hypothetical protein [Nocardia sp. NPDC059239]
MIRRLRQQRHRAAIIQTEFRLIIEPDLYRDVRAGGGPILAALQ